MAIRSISMLVLLLAVCGRGAFAICGGSDCVQHEISSQAQCTEVTRRATRDCRWVAGLDTNADFIVEGGDVVAYQIQWFSGAWSGWFVTGVNDIGWKVNLSARTCGVPYLANHMRRVWSNFYDHTHKFIICKHRGDYSGTPAPCPTCPSLPVSVDRLDTSRTLEDARNPA